MPDRLLGVVKHLAFFRLDAIRLLLGAAIATSFVRSAQSAGTGIPLERMPESAAAIIRNAIRGFNQTNAPARLARFGVRSIDATRIRQTNEAALVILERMPLPDLSRFQRVRYRRKDSPGPNAELFDGRWWMPTNGNQLVLFDESFRTQMLPRGSLEAFESGDYRKELEEVIGVLNGSNTLRQCHYDWQEIILFPEPELIPKTGLLWRHALSAAWIGYTNQAAQLLHHALLWNPGSPLWEMIHTSARNSFLQGLQSLREGEAYSVVAGHWTTALQADAAKALPKHLEEYVTLARKQADEFSRLTASLVENPDALPPQARVRYDFGLLPYSTTERRAGPLAQVEARFIGFGREAVPSLMEFLSDRRLTRFVGRHPWFRGGNYPDSDNVVVRVQDVALSCIEQIAGQRFLRDDPRPGLFSTHAESIRSSVMAGVSAWWTLHGQATDEAWELARLGKLPVSERVKELKDLETRRSDTTNILSLLMGWADENRSNTYDLELLLGALAERGDFSKTPLLREHWNQRRYARGDFLLRYGTAEEIGALRDYERQIQFSRSSPTMPNYIHAVVKILQTGFEDAGKLTNHLLLPVLLDGLEHRSVATIRRDRMGAQHVELSYADVCMEGLISLTGHDEGFVISQAASAKAAAIERWRRWWAETGQHAYLEQHPEVRPAFSGDIAGDVASVRPFDVPALAIVDSAETGTRIRYDMPRTDVLSLLRDRQITMRRAGNAFRFRFVSATAERRWFSDARAVSLLLSETNQLPATVVPAMHIDAVAVALPDSRGRTWLSRGLDSSDSIAIFDGEIRTVLTRPAGPYGPGDSYRAFSLAVPLADGAMLFSGRRDKRIHFFDQDKHTEFQDVRGFLRPENHKVILKSLNHPWHPARFHDRDGSFLRLVKDRDSNLWWTDGQNLGAWINGQEFTASRTDRALGAQGFFVHAWLFPLRSRPGVILANVANRAGKFVPDQNQLTKVAEAAFPAPSLGDTGEAWPRFVPDSQGRLWGSGRESVAFDENLSQVATHSGQVLIEDEDQGLWFAKFNHSLDVVLMRMTKEGKESRLSLPGMRATPYPATDGSVWVLTENELWRIVPGRDGLKVAEEFPVKVPGYARIWSDRRGRVWLLTLSGAVTRRSTVDCYATRR
jgi:hypothetical protein